ncbi:MAG: ABC transporter permease [Vicinamibacterales bacterium]
MLAVGLLGAAMAVSATVFSAADAFVFHPLPYEDPGGWCNYGDQKPGSTNPDPHRMPVPAGLVDAWRSQTDLFESLSAWDMGGVQYSYSQSRNSHSISLQPGLLETLGTLPAWGRAFVPEDAVPGAPPVAILAESLATDRFRSPADAIGKTFDTFSGRFTVVGVMPASFRFPDGRTRLWVPFDPFSYERLPDPAMARYVQVIGRLKTGVSRETANTAMATRAAALGVAWADLHERKQAPAPTVLPFRFPFDNPYVRPDEIRSQQSLIVLVVVGALCLLLTACANVASLELAGAMARARAHAVQMAIGASRARLLRQVAFEGLALVVASAGVALVAARLLTTLVRARVPEALTYAAPNAIDLDPRAVGFTLAAALVTWGLSTIPVVLLARRTDVLDVLRADGGLSAAGAGGMRFRRTLAAAAIALSTLLLIGAVLADRTYTGLLAVDRGYDTRNLATLELRVPNATYPSGLARQLLADRVLERLRRRPEVVAASEVEGMFPSFAGSSTSRVFTDAGEMGTATRYTYSADPTFLKTIGLPLLVGRPPFAGEADTHVVVSEPFARRFWPNGDALGQRFGPSADKLRFEIIGITRAVTHEFNPDGTRDDAYELYPALPRYTPENPRPGRATGLYPVTFVARLSDTSATGVLRAAVADVDPALTSYVSLVDDNYAAMFADRLATASVMSGFGAFAFVVAMAGVYGVMAFLVAGRRREIGIRMALGADAGQVGAMVLGSSLRLVASGALAGLGLALAASRWIESRLFGVSATDPVVFGAVALVVVVSAVVATSPPARTAAHLDPARTLRTE